MQRIDYGQEARGRGSGDVRFIGAIMGRYLLASRRNRVTGVQVFACRLQSISPRALVASAPVLGQPGEELVTHVHPFGMLRGVIDRLVDGGFWVEIEADDDERARLAKRIAWYKKRAHQGIEDKREHKRIMPRDPRSTLLLADGNVMDCLIIDMSCSGAAVSADIQPEIGTPLAVGQAVGRVVRWLDVGFAVKFVQELAPDMLEEMLHAALWSI